MRNHRIKPIAWIIISAALLFTLGHFSILADDSEVFYGYLDPGPYIGVCGGFWVLLLGYPVYRAWAKERSNEKLSGVDVQIALSLAMGVVFGTLYLIGSNEVLSSSLVSPVGYSNDELVTVFEAIASGALASFVGVLAVLVSHPFFRAWQSDDAGRFARRYIRRISPLAIGLLPAISIPLVSPHFGLAFWLAALVGGWCIWQAPKRIASIS